MTNIGSNNIKFSDLYKNFLSVDSNHNSSIPIKLSDFRTMGFSSGISMPASGAISIKDHFQNKTFNKYIFNIIKDLAKDLGSSNDSSTCQTAIESASSSFNTFARVEYGNLAENLVGKDGGSSGTYTFGALPFFIYNTSNNKLSTGNNIIDMTGGEAYSINGKKWMANAIYTASDAFKGILLWCFHGETTGGTSMPISTAKTIFSRNDNNEALADNVYHKITGIVIDHNGNVIASSSSSGTTGWNFSAAQFWNVSSNGGFYQTGRFSYDDGIWGFRIDGVVQGDAPGPDLYDESNTNNYGFGNYSSGYPSTQPKVIWGASTISTSDFIGYIFTGDR